MANANMARKAIARFEASQREDVIPADASPTRTSGSSKEMPKTRRMRATKLDQVRFLVLTQDLTVSSP